MKQDGGYIKLYRKFLTSQVRRLKPSARCAFIDFLLLADYKSGEIRTSYRELAQTLTTRNQNTVKLILDSLEHVGAIKTKREPHLTIKILNWKRYQAGPQKEPAEAVENLWKSATKSVADATKSVAAGATKNVAKCYEKCSSDNNKVPVSINVFKEKEYFLAKSVPHLNITNPQTDLEKLALFFAKGTKHPALKKPNANELLNIALKNDLPHFKTVLAACEDLEQAQKIVARFVKNSRGHYALYYLAQQVNSYRQELESEENKA